MNYKVSFRKSVLDATMTVRQRYHLWRKDIISVESEEE